MVLPAFPLLFLADLMHFAAASRMKHPRGTSGIIPTALRMHSIFADSHGSPRRAGGALSSSRVNHVCVALFRLNVERSATLIRAGVSLEAA